MFIYCVLIFINTKMYDSELIFRYRNHNKKDNTNEFIYLIDIFFLEIQMKMDLPNFDDSIKTTYYDLLGCDPNSSVSNEIILI